nr:alpha/beta hydrolase [Fructobacillus papyriferae]
MLFKDQKISFSDVVVPDSVGRVSLDQTYGPKDWQRYDVYLPIKNKEKCPVVLDLQGGGLVRGRKSSEKLAPNLKLTAAGLAVVSMNYALISDRDYAFPKQVAEVRAVLGQLKKRSDEFGIDENKIYLAGESSGAQLALLTVGSISAGVKVGHEFGLKDELEAMPKIKKVLAAYGPYEFDVFKEQFAELGVQPKYSESGSKNSFEGLALAGHQVNENPIAVSQGNPANYFTPAMPDLFAMAGSADQVVPELQSMEMVDRYEKLTGKKALTYWLDGAHHGIKDFDTKQVYQMKCAFFKA